MREIEKMVQGKLSPDVAAHFARVRAEFRAQGTPMTEKEVRSREGEPVDVKVRVPATGVA